MSFHDESDIEKEAQKRTPWGKMLRALQNSDFKLCYNWIVNNNSELIFVDSNRALILYAYSHGPYVDILRIYGELAISKNAMSSKQQEALWWINYLIDGKDFCFFESNAKGYLKDFIKDFIPKFDFCNPWHSTLDNVNLCNPTEIGYPGARFPRTITRDKLSDYNVPSIKKMIPNMNKTDWYSPPKIFW